MRNAILILTILTVFSCRSGTSNSDGSSANAEVLNPNKNDDSKKRNYISDSSYLNYDYPTELKNGYRLEYRVYVESPDLDTIQTLFLLKGADEIKDLNGGSYGLPHKNIGYIGSDFDSSFIFVQSFGSGNPHYIQLINKKTGKEIRTGIWVDADENEQVMLYMDKKPQEAEKLVVYDIKNKNEIIITEFNESKCVRNVADGLRKCVEIDTVTTDEIVLKIDTQEELIKKRFKR